MSSTDRVNRALGVALAVAAASGCDNLFYLCPSANPEQLALLPARLSETGLYADITADAIANDVLPYRPAFELWSDGADKRRWLWIPPGDAIDTRDMDQWRFPTGTKVWKEFSRGGIRLETRLLSKLG